LKAVEGHLYGRRLQHKGSQHKEVPTKGRAGGQHAKAALAEHRLGQAKGTHDPRLRDRDRKRRDGRLPILGGSSPKSRLLLRSRMRSWQATFLKGGKSINMPVCKGSSGRGIKVGWGWVSGAGN